MDSIVTNQTIRKALRGGNTNGQSLSGLLKAYYKNPIRIEEVTTPENRDNSQCGNSAVINSEKIVYDRDMTTKEINKQVEFWEGLQI